MHSFVSQLADRRSLLVNSRRHRGYLDSIVCAGIGQNIFLIQLAFRVRLKKTRHCFQFLPILPIDVEFFPSNLPESLLVFQLLLQPCLFFDFSLSEHGRFHDHWPQLSSLLNRSGVLKMHDVVVTDGNRYRLCFLLHWRLLDWLSGLEPNFKRLWAHTPCELLPFFGFEIMRDEAFDFLLFRSNRLLYLDGLHFTVNIDENILSSSDFWCLLHSLLLYR